MTDWRLRDGLDQQEISGLLEALRGSEREICIFGAGRIGSGRGYACLKELGLRVSFFCDNDIRKIGCDIVDGIICISPEELKKDHSNVFVFIMLGEKDCRDVILQLDELGTFDHLEMKDVFLCDDHVNRTLLLDKTDESYSFAETVAPLYSFDTIKNPKHKPIAIYMCVTGGYDTCPEPEMVESDLADYYYITDEPKERESIFSYIPVSEVVPPSVTDSIRQNRFCKILGCDIFSEYPFSIYLDGNSCICGKISDYLSTLNELGISLRSGNHKPYDCVYAEATWAINVLGDRNTIVKQMHKYREEGMPRHWGMFDLNCIVRDNRNLRLRELMREWWSEVYNYSYRDRLSFTYVLWKNGIEKKDIALIDEDEWDKAKEYYIVRLHR